MKTRNMTFALTGIAPLSQSRSIEEIELLSGETFAAREHRVWKMKAHVDPETKEVVIPAMALKKSIAEAAKRLSLKKSGNAKWTNDILSSVIVTGDVSTGVHIDSTREEVVYCHVDGNPKSGKRVNRSFPVVPSGWKGQASVVVIDPAIPEHIIEQCIHAAGNIIGVGRFRPEKGGYLGRFKVEKIKWGSEA